MSHKKQFSFIFSLLLMLSSTVAGQDTTAFDGVRFSYDVGTIPALYLFPEQRRIEVQADFKFAPNYYGVAEFGLLELDTTRENYAYSQQGSFYRIGIEYNAIAAKDDLLAIGGRIGSSHFTQQASDIYISPTDSIWRDVYFPQIPEQSHTVFWLELTLGMKVEVFRNFYLGWTLRGKAMLFGAKSDHLEPYIIPGFGRGNRKTAASVNYYISYKIPLDF